MFNGIDSKVISIILLVFSLIPLLIICIVLKIFYRGSIFFIQERIGKNKKLFKLYKFRTMIPNTDNIFITIGNLDYRITSIGRFLRKYKLDELPQFINVLKGNLNIVGPRPDVPKYIKHYEKLFPDYYKMKPGITCYSSLELSNEAELYIGIDDPEKFYIEKVIPLKVELDKKYFYEQSLKTDLKIILLTIKKIFIKRNK